MTAQAIDFRTAAGRRPQLRDVVCSEPWVESIIAPAPDGTDWRYLPDIYPPGREKTQMRVCPACRRICPPAGGDGQPCCDCQTEQEEDRYIEWIVRRERRELREDIARLWWRSAIPIADQPFIISRDWKRKKRKAKDRSPTTEFAGACLSDGGGPPLPIEFFGREWVKAVDGCPYDTRELLEDGELGRGSETRGIRIALEIARRRLDPPKKEKGRAPGCQVLLLPESEKALRKEIAYFKAKRRVMPSARRYSRHSPYMLAPEDFDSWTRYCRIREDEAESLNAESAVAWG